MQSSTRRGIQYPNLDRSDRPDVPLHIKNLVDALEIDLPVSQGTFASRPANPGYPRWAYWGTDTHLMYYWDGSAWFTVGTSDVIPQTLIDAKGDLLVGLTDNVAGRLPISTNDFGLIADNAQPSGMRWARDIVLDLIAAKGDLLVGTAVDALARVAVGANGQTILADSAQASGIKWGAPTLPYLNNFLGADVTMTTSGTYYDGPTVSLTVGTWFLSGYVLVQKLTNTPEIVVKLWDGTSAAIASGANAGEPGTGATVNVSGIAVVGSTTSYKISATCPNDNGALIKATPPNGGSPAKASQLTALQIA